ncbi:helix-turn-helix domain-containing protein [Cobetia sp. ICG0124]|uniref:winged helix-turn-helix domain-containing protein n=1 Tax=Cobetia sp. ICG0124 TaxID=2053669 RepID=UPI001F0B8587|nr:helix-turn-helix domain-containing protein [Cobetia sp. ICG0124]
MLLLRRVGELFSRAYLLEMVWGINGDISTRTVDTHISRLRRKLELDGRRGLRLKSVYQHGYRLETCTQPLTSILRSMSATGAVSGRLWRHRK